MGDFETAISLDPELAPGWYNLGMAYEDLGDSEQALVVYGEALAFAPEDINILIDRALVNSTLGNNIFAEAAIDHVLQIGPDYAKAYLVRAYAQVKLGRDVQSESEIDRAVALGVNRAEAEKSITEPTPSP